MSEQEVYAISGSLGEEEEIVGSDDATYTAALYVYRVIMQEAIGYSMLEGPEVYMKKHEISIPITVTLGVRNGEFYVIEGIVPEGEGSLKHESVYTISVPITKVEMRESVSLLEGPEGVLVPRYTFAGYSNVRLGIREKG